MMYFKFILQNNKTTINNLVGYIESLRNDQISILEEKGISDEKSERLSTRLSILNDNQIEIQKKNAELELKIKYYEVYIFIYRIFYQI